MDLDTIKEIYEGLDEIIDVLLDRGIPSEAGLRALISDLSHINGYLAAQTGDE